MTDVGYARVSTADQDPQLQLDALEAAGVTKVFTDEASGARASRPELDECMKYLRPGDTLVVWKLDRLGRNVGHLVATLNGLAERGIEFRSLTEGMDTSNAAGRLLFHIFASLAEFERELIRERTLAGLAAARAKGHYGGRPRALSARQEEMVRTLKASGTGAVEIARTLGVGTSTVYRALNAAASS